MFVGMTLQVVLLHCFWFLCCFLQPSFRKLSRQVGSNVQVSIVQTTLISQANPQISSQTS